MAWCIFAPMRILVACEESQAVCIAFRERGHEAYSCDILPCSGGHPEWHIQDDVLKHLNDGWDMMIGHPPCTFISKAGARWMYKGGKLNYERYAHGLMAKTFFNILLDAPISMIAIENPTPLTVLKMPKHSQVIQPYEFGHEYSKRTLLWLKNLPPLIPTLISNNYTPYLPSNTGGKKNGQKYSFGKSRNQIESSKTFPGIARAMASQWG